MKKFTKIIGMMLLSATLIGCKETADSNNVVNISILNSKPELQALLDEAIDDFEAVNPDIRIKVVKYNQSQSYQDKLISMEQYGNTPTMILMDPAHVNFIKDDIISLNNEKWVENVSINLSDVAKNEQGELVAFPFALEGIGFIYNAEVLSKAGVDPSQINSLDKLEEAFKKVEASGKGALIIANEDWSLANHFLPLAYSVQGSEGENNLAFVDALKQGAANLKENTYFNGVLNTLDIMKQYNIYADSPLMHTASKCAELLGKGEVGFYYMGNWASVEIMGANSNAEIGFVPVPVSNNSSDFGNSQITAVIKYLVVDGASNSPEQQEAAKRFIDWLVYDEVGQTFMVDKASVIPGVDNNERPIEDDLMKSIIEYQQAGKIIELNNADIPKSNAEIIGNYLRQYLDNQIDRETLISLIENHWKNASSDEKSKL